ncbi:aminotransferase class I/II-fold pyridoxal phosphate-dependent enzyme [Nesterenkonia sp. PF2B19]|uniref:aminotransferase class I/II-fold pyridoxal phosphate-dependent enzyme n=1 Tax=Nesterenkonia sp. PF2B19 TaxID=1881858 RepID=UPI001481D3F9|nr:PLP-dependent aminotransferase family protein [Nesterenkonia sp. PF2B19]
MADVEAESLARSLTERSPAGIAEQIRELIAAGVLTAGMRLPTVRDVATEIGVSVGTVAQLALLREGGLVETRRRGGTRIIEGADPLGGEFAGWSGVDLLYCSPDPHLLPPLDEALAKALKQPGINAWGREHMLPELQKELQKRLTDQPREFVTVSSGTEALWLATRAAAESGDTIAVEEPTSPGYLSVLQSMGLRAVGVPVDEQGPVPERLSEALEAGAVAFVHSPGGAFSDRHTLTPERGLALEAALEAAPEVLIIEDDPLGPLGPGAAPSLDALFPERTVRVLGFERAFGMDLRTSALAGPRELVQRCVRHRSGGVASNSRILQHALVQLLRDPVVSHRLTSARGHYATRRRLALEAFEAAGLTARAGTHSWAVWVEVADDRAGGPGAQRPGGGGRRRAASHVTEQPTGLLRFSVAQLPEDDAVLAELAQLVHRAAVGELGEATFV